MNVEPILGYPITSLPVGSCISQIESWIQSGLEGKYFACANPHSLVMAQSDGWFETALKHADFLVPDGIGIILASRMLGGNIRKRITGTDIFMGLCGSLNNRRGFSMFFLGSTEDNLTRICDQAQQDFPHIRIAGRYAPPYKPEFDDEDNRRMIEAINRVQPDVLWIGMTAPKQEKWAYQHKDRLKVKFIGPIGAVFDFYTGQVKRSHPIFQKMGLEWLPRLLQQPRRLYDRTLISAPRFLRQVIAERIRQTCSG